MDERSVQRREYPGAPHPLLELQSQFPVYNAGAYVCKFTEETIRAFQLLDVLLHELGHHHDRMTTRSRRRASRGEAYAERYARIYEARIWQQYLKVFRLESR